MDRCRSKPAFTGSLAQPESSACASCWFWKSVTACLGERPKLEDYLEHFPDDRDVVALALADAASPAAGNDAARPGADQAASLGSAAVAGAATNDFQPGVAVPMRAGGAVLDAAPRRGRSTSLGQAVRRLTDSELMTPAEVEDLLAMLPPEKCDGKRTIEEMYHRGRLTRFQAQAIYQGKTRRPSP